MNTNQGNADQDEAQLLESLRRLAAAGWHEQLRTPDCVMWCRAWPDGTIDHLTIRAATSAAATRTSPHDTQIWRYPDHGRGGLTAPLPDTLAALQALAAPGAPDAPCEPVRERDTHWVL